MDTAEMLYIAGHRGLLGSAIWRAAEHQGRGVLGADKAALDLRELNAVDAFLQQNQPQALAMCAGRPGGISSNSAHPVDYLVNNLQIQTTLLEAAVRHRVERCIFFASTAVYPKYAPRPLREDMLLLGPLEPTSEAYGIAKLAGLFHIQAIRRQYGLPYTGAILANLYGPGDNFDLASGRVIPAMIRKMHEAKLTERRYVEMWGTGLPHLEFLYVDDAAAATLFLLESYDQDEPVNVGSGETIRVADLAVLIQEVVGYRGHFLWNPGRPDATGKLLDTRKIRDLGWRPSVGLQEGIRRTYEWFLNNELEYTTHSVS